MSNVQLKEFQDRADEADKLLALLKVRLEHIESNAAAVAALPKADKKKSNSGTDTAITAICSLPRVLHRTILWAGARTTIYLEILVLLVGPQPVSDFKEFQASVLAELEEVKKDALRDAEEKNKVCNLFCSSYYYFLSFRHYYVMIMSISTRCHVRLYCYHGYCYIGINRFVFFDCAACFVPSVRAFLNGYGCMQCVFGVCVVRTCVLRYVFVIYVCIECLPCVCVEMHKKQLLYFRRMYLHIFMHIAPCAFV